MSESASPPSPPSSDSEKNSDNNFEDITADVPADVPADHKSAMDRLDENLPETVSLLRTEGGGRVYLVGTAHFSTESQDDVSRVIRAVQPQVVMIELCSSRINILQLDEKTLLDEAKSINLEKSTKIIRQNGVFNGIMYILLLSMSAHLTKELGMAPGGEFRRAFQEVSKVRDCLIHLGDRPIHITLHRAIARLTWFQTLKLGWHLLTSSDPISKEDVEKCKRRDMLEELLSEMTGEFPALGEVFVHERDVYMTSCLQGLAGPRLDAQGRACRYDRIVAVVGIGHVPGITRLWPQPQLQNVAAIVTVPPPSLASRLARASLKLSALSLGGLLLLRYVPASRRLAAHCSGALRKALSL